MAVRPAVPADAAAIARVHVAAWRAAYRGVMPDAYLAGLDEAQFARGWERALEERVSTVIVGVAGHAVQGFATLGAARDEPPVATGELYALNLHPEAFGTGLGAHVHEAALRELAAQGHGAAYLWVAELNPRARRFYEREGWAPDGGAKEEGFGTGTVRELRYARALP